MKPSHVRGWLLLFVLHALLMTAANTYFALRNCLRILQFMPLYFTSPSARTFGAYVAGRTVLESAFVVLLVVGLNLTLSLDTRTRGYWRVALPSAILCQAAVLLLTWMEHSALTTLRPGIHPPSMSPIVRLEIIFSSIGLWWIYWDRSRRMKDLFSPTPPGLTAAA